MAKDARVMCAAVVLVCTLSAVWGAVQALERVVTERRLVSVDKIAGRPESFVVSPDRTRVAYVAPQRAKQVMVIDGQAGTLYDALERALFSPDSRRVAYVARLGPKQVMVIDGQPSAPYDRLATDTLSFSPDSRRVAYAAQAGPKWVVVVDGQAGPPYEGIGEVVFSPDSKRVAYAVQVGPKRLIVVDGRGEQPYDDLVANSLLFSPDSRHLAYGVITGHKEVVVIDGKPGGPYDGIGAGTVRFSPDSKRVAYAAQVGAKWVVVVDGKQGPPYDLLVGNTLTFSPDSKRVAYAVRVGQQRAVVVDGHVGPRYAGIGAVRFSPDSRRVAYAAEAGQQQFAVVDGQPGPPYAKLADNTLIFSPDSQHVVYVAQVGQQQFVVVVDGEPGTPYQSIFQRTRSPLAFAAPDRFSYVAVKGVDVVLVEERLRGGASPAARSQPAEQVPTARIEELIGLLTSPDVDKGAFAALMLIAIGRPVVAPLQHQRQVWQQQADELGRLLDDRAALGGGGPGTEPHREDYPRGWEGRSRYEQDKGQHDQAARGFYSAPDQLRPLYRALGFADKVLKEVQGR